MYGENWSHDPEVDAWYLTMSAGEACKTESPGQRIVNIDYDHYGTSSAWKFSESPKNPRPE